MARTSRRPGKCRWASHPRSPGAGCCTARDSQRARVFGRMRVGRSSGDPSSVDPPAGTRWNRRTVRAIHGRRAGDVSGSSSSAPDRSGSRLCGIGRMGAGTVAPRARRVGCRIVLWSHRAHGCQPLPAHRRGRPLRDIRRAPALPMVRGSFQIRSNTAAADSRARAPSDRRRPWTCAGSATGSRPSSGAAGFESYPKRGSRRCACRTGAPFAAIALAARQARSLDPISQRGSDSCAQAGCAGRRSRRPTPLAAGKSSRSLASHRAVPGVRLERPCASPTVVSSAENPADRGPRCQTPVVERFHSRRPGNRRGVDSERPPFVGDLGITSGSSRGELARRPFRAGFFAAARRSRTASTADQREARLPRCAVGVVAGAPVQRVHVRHAVLHGVACELALRVTCVRVRAGAGLAPRGEVLASRLAVHVRVLVRGCSAIGPAARTCTGPRSPAARRP